jgi:hypothetical protein
MDLPPAVPVSVTFQLSASERRIENQLGVSHCHFQGAKISEIWVRGEAKESRRSLVNPLRISKWRQSENLENEKIWYIRRQFLELYNSY